jgi:hypothetical protein
MRTHSIVGAILLLASGACAGSQAEQVRDARMEQAEARAQSEVKQADENAEARDRAIEQRHDAVTQNMEATNPPSESAAEDMVQVSKDRMQYQSDAKTKLDKLGARLNEAREKLTVLGGRAPTGLKTEFTTATNEYNMLQKDVKNLDKTPASSWEATTEQLEKRMASLDDRVEDLTDRIEDV